MSLSTRYCTDDCPALENAQALCEDLYVIVGISPKRVALFSKIQDEIDTVQDLKLQIDTNHVSRSRKAPKKMEDFIVHDVAPSGHDCNDLKTELKRAYFGAIDSILSSTKERFHENANKIVKDINHMLNSCANSEADVTTEYVIKHLGIAAKFVAVDLLIEELKELHVHIQFVQHGIEAGIDACL
ncbi:Hypothetical predicted protein [Paramuricea clavata]|uniref:Uncharacterized protein n=1 Tax=Paramuricea clavata TaxID=317549 RepID=A0A7D9IHG8_PARCT|nr:Hypothetical predicted protein [Paramuricea clavata]